MTKQFVVVDGELYINQSAVLDMVLNKGGQVVITGLGLGGVEKASYKVLSAEEVLEHFSRVIADSRLGTALDAASSQALGEAEAENIHVRTSDPYSPVIIWRRNHAQERQPVEVDVQDGRAEYVLSGPYYLTEAAKIEVVNGQVLFCSGKHYVR